MPDQERDPSPQSLRAPDWLNFFLPDGRTGVGPFRRLSRVGAPLESKFNGFTWDSSVVSLDTCRRRVEVSSLSPAVAISAV
jgi:hypothetical protein